MYQSYIAVPKRQISEFCWSTRTILTLILILFLFHQWLKMLGLIPYSTSFSPVDNFSVSYSPPVRIKSVAYNSITLMYQSAR
jgi:hypothetical protein